MERGNAAVVPTVEEVRTYVGESLFDDFFTELTQKEGAKPVMEFGRCSWEYGWNMKFKKSGKTLCTLYPREHFFTVMVVIGQREKAAAEALLPALALELGEIYRNAKEGNGQRWLMVDWKGDADVSRGALALIRLRNRRQ